MVMAPPDAGEDVERQAQSLRFMRDGTHFWALIFPGLFLLWHRLWLALLLYLAIVLALALAGEVVDPVTLLLLSALPGLYLFVDAAQLLRGRLERRGWHVTAIVEADNLGEAELRFFNRDQAVANQSGVRPPSLPPRTPVAFDTARTTAAPSINLFDD